MRTRDEVLIGSYRYTLRENGWTMTHVDHDNKTPVTWPHTVEMIERVRELEAQQAASEPVAVTEEMEEAFMVAYAECEFQNGGVFTHRMGINAVITAALTAASEGASA